MGRAFFNCLEWHLGWGHVEFKVEGAPGVGSGGLVRLGVGRPGQWRMSGNFRM